jgi:hypothetical protein
VAGDPVGEWRPSKIDEWSERLWTRYQPHQLLGGAGAVLLVIVAACGIAFWLFNAGDVPKPAAIVMSVLAGIAGLLYVCAFLANLVKGREDWW